MIYQTLKHFAQEILKQEAHQFMFIFQTYYNPIEGDAADMALPAHLLDICDCVWAAVLTLSLVLVVSHQLHIALQLSHRE